jgi:hypothetical protein
MIHEILGRFIEEAVARALQEQIGKMVESAEKRAEEVLAAGTARLNQTLDCASADVDKRVHQMIEQGLGTLAAEAERLDRTSTEIQERIAQMIKQGLGTLTAEAERLDRTSAEIQERITPMIEQGLGTLTTEADRLAERNTQRLEEISHKVLDDMPVTIQESLMQMTQENEAMFHRRAEEWMTQFRAEQTADMSQVLQAQFEAVRRSMLEEVAQSAKAICDRNLFDVRSDFENHINRTFQYAAERLAAPFVRQ